MLGDLIRAQAKEIGCILYKYRSYGSCYIGGNQVRVNAHVILHANSLFLINVLEEN